MSQLYASLFYQKDVTDIFSDSSLIAYMIQVEVALAQAQAQVGVIPQNAANTIAQVAEHALDKFDFSNSTMLCDCITASQAISPSSHDWTYMVTTSFTNYVGT